MFMRVHLFMIFICVYLEFMIVIILIIIIILGGINYKFCFNLSPYKLHLSLRKYTLIHKVSKIHVNFISTQNIHEPQ